MSENEIEQEHEHEHELFTYQHFGNEMNKSHEHEAMKPGKGLNWKN